MIRCVLGLMLVFFFAGTADATVMLSRSGTTIRALQVFGFVAGNYYQTTKKYDWAEGRFAPLAESLRTNVIKADVIVAFSLLPRLEIIGVVPYSALSSATASASGVGDVWLSLRYGVLGGVLPVKLALQGAAVLPTAPEGKPALRDRTSDIGLGMQANTIRLGPLAVHARAAYWLQGKKADGTRVGNLTEYLLFPDVAISKTASVYVGIAGAVKDEDVKDSLVVANSGVMQHNINGGIVWNPFGPLYIKPKAAWFLPGASTGSVLPDFSVGLDVWAAVP